MPRQAQAKTFEEKVWYVIEETQNDKGGGTVLRVMSWIVDGKMQKPQIDKRDFWMTEDNEKRVGKAKGLTGFDFLNLLRKRYVIAEHLKLPKQDVDIAVEMETVAEKPEPATAGAPPVGQGGF